MKQIIFLLILLVLVSGLWKSYSGPSRQQSFSRRQGPDPTLLTTRIQKAKAAGITEVILPGPTPYLAEVSGLADAIIHYSVIVGKVKDATSLQVDGRKIMTYYKFQILEKLSDRQALSGGAPEELPAALTPLATNEIYVLEGGGTITLDGTRVTQTSDYEYSKNQTYLLFLSKNSAQSIGMVNLGKHGVFSVKDDTLEAISKDGSPLKRDLSEQHSNKLTNLRAVLARGSKELR